MATTLSTTNTLPLNHSFKALSDEELFRRYASEDDERAFDEIAARYTGRIRGFLVKRIGDDAKADDLTQDVLLRVVRAKPSFDPSRNFASWIHTIVNNVLKNYFRSLARQKEDTFTTLTPARAAPTDYPPFDPTCTRLRDPEREAYCSEIRERITTALADLDDLFREPFLMHQVDGMSYRRISEILAIPIGTAKSRAHRACILLRNAMPELGPILDE